MSLAERAARSVDVGRGLPAASALELRIGRAVALSASLGFALAALWEIGGPFGAGHYAAACAVGVAGENTLRFHSLWPVTDVPLGAPSPADCYCHHPFGIFWTAALFVGAFGHHDFVLRLPAVLQSALTPPLLYALARALYGPLAGALAALGFALTPIALAFSNFNSLEVPLIFGSLLACLGYVRFLQSGRRRFFCLALGALAYCLDSDWPAYVFAACLAALALSGALLRRARGDARGARQSLELALGFCLLTALIGVAYLLALAHADKLRELVAEGAVRSAGNASPFEKIAARRYWIALMFTPLAVWLGKLALPVSCARTLARRDELEALPLCLLAMAVFQYVVFAQGADVHIFWPHYFAPYFALGLALLARSLVDLFSVWERRSASSRTSSKLAPIGFFSACALVPLCMAPDALRNLVYARKTGGRFNERGHFIQPDKDKLAALEFVSRHSAPADVVALNAVMKRSLWVPWVLERPNRVVGSSASAALVIGGAAARFFVNDARFAEGTALLADARRMHADVVGPFWIFDRSRPAAPVEANTIAQREPGLLERFFVSGSHALRAVTPNAYATWEARDALSELPNPAPGLAPSNFEELRIAHNIALKAGDFARAERLLASLFSGADTRTRLRSDDGSELIASRFERGASEVLTLYFRASAQPKYRFVVHSRVESKPALSLIPADELEWDVGLPVALPRALWKPGYVYSSITEISKRPGREHFFGAWVGAFDGFAIDKASEAAKVSLLILQ